MIVERRVMAVVAMGGFVSGPAVVAAQRAGVPVALVNLDAVPGKANRRMAGGATKVYTAYAGSLGGEHIGLPLRRSAVADHPSPEARRALGLDPDRQTLLIVGGSQGASTINNMMIHLVGEPGEITFELRSQWQVLHLTGDRDLDPIRLAYERSGITARVEAFLACMGDAWASATLAISRAGAGSVAEVWANATPTLFLPYPYHKDQHQSRNAASLVATGAAYLLQDQIDPASNARQISDALLRLMCDASQRAAMSQRLRETWPGDGAETVASWLAQLKHRV